jgi:hypothetical protein
MVWGGPARSRLTPQLAGKAVHIVEFLWVAPPIAPNPWKAAPVTIATRPGLGDRVSDDTRRGDPSQMCTPAAVSPPPPHTHPSCPQGASSFPQGLTLHLPTLRPTSPYGAVREPASVTVVKAILKGSLQVSWGCDGGRAETAGLLGLRKGQCIAVPSCPIVEHNTWVVVGGHQDGGERLTLGVFNSRSPPCRTPPPPSLVPTDLLKDNPLLPVLTQSLAQCWVTTGVRKLVRATEGSNLTNIYYVKKQL